MTDTRKVQLGTEVDPSGAQAGFDQVAAAAQGLRKLVDRPRSTDAWIQLADTLTAPRP